MRNTSIIVELEFGKHLKRRLEPEDLVGPVIQSVLN